MSIIPGTRHLDRWPHYPDSSHMRIPKGILSYGRIKRDGVSTLKVSKHNAHQLVALGWSVVHVGSDYAYMLEPEEDE